VSERGGRDRCETKWPYANTKSACVPLPLDQHATNDRYSSSPTLPELQENIELFSIPEPNKMCHIHRQITHSLPSVRLNLPEKTLLWLTE